MRISYKLFYTPGTKYKMPGKFKPRRRVARKPMRKYRARKFRSPYGGFSITRKLPLITLSAMGSGINGQASLNDPTGTCLSYSVLGLSPGTSVSYDVGFSLKFTLAQLQQYTDIQNIADAYKINKVNVKLSSAYQVSTGAVTPLPWVEFINDHDDATVPTLSVMRQKMGIKTKYFGPTRTVINMAVRPRTSDVIYNNGITNSYGVNSPQWINSANPNVEHYAIKGVIHNVYLAGVANQGLLTWDISTNVSAKDLQ